jgi:hypothetical protein
MRTSPFTSPTLQSGLSAAELLDARADKPSGLFIGFDIMRELQRLRPKELKIK